MEPKSPSPNYDFIMQDKKTAKKKLPLPSLPKLPKPFGTILVIVFVIFLLIIIIAVAFRGGSGGNQPLTDAMARAQEISRVSSLVQQAAPDSQTKDLAVTVQGSLGSEEAQFNNYIQKSGGKKVNLAKLTTDQNSNSDAQVKTAAQNNNLGQFYTAYLKNGLATYKSLLQTAYTSAKGDGKTTLSNAYNSIQVILNSI